MTQQSDSDMPGQPGRAASLYTRLSSLREPFLRRAREASALTLPYLLRDSGRSTASDFDTQWQSVGARAVNNLASKLQLTLFPPSAPFFRLQVDESASGILEASDDIRTEVEETLGEWERNVMFVINTGNFRVKAFESFQHLVVAGNCLVQMLSEESYRVFHLDSYVVERDVEGMVQVLVVRETVSAAQLPEDVRRALMESGAVPDANQDASGRSEQKNYFLYTAVVLKEDGSAYDTWQEVANTTIPDSDEVVSIEDLSFLPLRFYEVDDEDYGRGLVEQYIGDLRSLEGLSASIVEAAAATARLLVLVRPNGVTRLSDVATAPNGAVRKGDAQDVSFMQAEKQSDLRVAAEVAQRIEQRLSMAFLLNTSVQRQAERVTAEEIRYMAQELEDSLGGVYSVQSQELQLPIVNMVMRKMRENGRLPALPNEDLVKATVVTGLESLGRGHDLQRLQVAFDLITRTYGPEALAAATNMEDAMRRVFTSLGIDPSGLLKTEEERAQEQQQAQMAGMAQQLAPEVVKQMGNTNRQG